MVNAVITFKAKRSAAESVKALLLPVVCAGWTVSMSPGSNKVSRNNKWSVPFQICLAPSWVNKPMVNQRLAHPPAQIAVSASGAMSRS